eukprot:1661490-Amphidinium_carterae.1
METILGHGRDFFHTRDDAEHVYAKTSSGQCAVCLERHEEKSVCERAVRNDEDDYEDEDDY